MKFNIDSYIEIGKTHEMCEDYATHGTLGGVPYIIVSDGCSSSENTDVGSRLLTYACRNALSEVINHNLLEDLDVTTLRNHLKEQILFNLRLSLKALSLHSSVADATLLFAFVWEGKVFYFMYGDGHIILNWKDGQPREVVKISYADNAPPYLSYNLDIRRKEGYREQFGKGMVNETFKWYDEPGPISVNEFLSIYDGCISGVIDTDNLQSITLSSDGIESYMFGKDSTVPSGDRFNATLEHIWQSEYTNYKSTGGEFVKRRMKRIKLNNEKNHIEHYDDVSCATIWIDHEL